jgi:two-component system NtrC family sensor kinase
VGHGLKPRGIDLMTRLEATRPVWINVFDLEQVLVNLIFNAANAVTDGGRVVITTRDAEPGGVVLAVEDNGRGIPEEQLKNIFDPFFTGDALRGTGLGLSVSYGLVRRYDGNISVTSVIGKGSRFEVWLPQRSAARSSDRDGSPEATQEESRDHHYA